MCVAGCVRWDPCSISSHFYLEIEVDKPRIEKAGHLRWKYLILIFILVASVFTLDFAGFLDPLSFLLAPFPRAILPAVSNAVGAGTALLRHAGLPFPGDLWTALSQNLMIQTTFRQGAVIGLAFLGVILLNLVRPRFWCRYVCPAGALLGVLARWHPSN